MFFIDFIEFSSSCLAIAVIGITINFIIELIIKAK